MASKVEPGHRSLTAAGRAAKGNSGGNSIGVFCVFLSFTILVVIFLGVMGVNISQRIRNNESKIQRIDAEIGKLDRELINLNSQYAACTTREFISSQIARFGLRLRPTPPSHRKALLVYTGEQIDRMAEASPAKNNRGFALKRGRQR